MSRGTWAILAGALLFFVNAWIYLDVHNKSFTKREAKLHEIIDAVEMDLNTYDPQTSRDKSAIARSMKVADAMRQKADAHRALLDSIRRMTEEGMYGEVEEYTEKDTPETPIPGYIDYYNYTYDDSSNYSDDDSGAVYYSQR